MIEITCTASSARLRRGSVVAVLPSTGTQLEVAGEPDLEQIRDVALLDMDMGETVTFEADPDRWARILPQAFRSGDLVSEVTGDPGPHRAAREAIARDP
jgi:hypothetical protein